MQYNQQNKKNLRKNIVIFASLIAFLFSCASREALQPPNFTDFLLLSSLGPFDMASKKTASPAIQNYFKVYFDVIPNLRMHSGYYISPRKPYLADDAGYISRDLLLSAHMLSGAQSDAGTVILIHGYNGTARYTHFQYFAQQFIKRGFRVVLLNLPGHEFSGGYRGSVESFEDYGNMVMAFLGQYRKQLGPKTYLIGMSTGSVSIFDAMRRDKDLFSSVDKVALIVPFLYIKNSGVLNFASYFANSVSSKKSGPLTTYNIPSKWIRKAQQWGKAREQERELQIQNQNVFIAFAEQDKVIDGKKAQEFYKEVYPNARIKAYAGQDHLLSKSGYEIFREEIMSFFVAQESKD